MRLLKGLKLRSLLNETIVVPEDTSLVNFNKIIQLNSSAAYLWNNVVGKDFDAQTLADLLVSNYEIDMETALTDSEAVIEMWRNAGVIEE